MVSWSPGLLQHHPPEMLTGLVIDYQELETDCQRLPNPDLVKEETNEWLNEGKEGGRQRSDEEEKVENSTLGHIQWIPAVPTLYPSTTRPLTSSPWGWGANDRGGICWPGRSP